MPLVPIAFPKKSNPARYKAHGAARLLNAYVEEVGEEGKKPLSLYSSDGLKVFADTGSKLPCRGAIAFDHEAFIVVGYHLYRLTPSGKTFKIGTIAGKGPISIDHNQHRPTQIAIVSEDGGNYVLEGGKLTSNPDKDLIKPNSVAFLNQYLVYFHRDGRITSTAISDATDINALDYDSAEYSSDRTLKGVAKGSELWVFGEKTIEIWQPAGGEGLPFLRQDAIEIGTLSGASVQTYDGIAFWVADDRTVRAAKGYDAQKISTHAVDRDLAKVKDPETITSMVWNSVGHTFYSITSDEFTWVYDLTTGLWHERQSHERKNWRCGVAFEFRGKKLFGDNKTGIIYEQDAEVFTEGEAPLPWKALLSITHATPNRLIMNELLIDAVTGMTESNQEAFINVRVSRDNAHTWFANRQLSLGAVGEYSKRLKANRFGASKKDGFVIELSSSDETVRAISGIYADIEKIGI